MTEIDPSRYEAIMDGSDSAKDFCRDVFEPYANRLAGQVFNESNLTFISDNCTLTDIDECTVYINFSANMSGQDEETGVRFTQYNVGLTFSRFRQPDEFWPSPEEQAENLGYDPSEEDSEDSDAESAVAVLFGEDGEEEVGVFYVCDDYVCESWEYFLDDELFRPRKEISISYFNGRSELLGSRSTRFREISGLILSGEGSRDVRKIMQEDDFLQTRDQQVLRSFSTDDLDLIKALCNRDQAAITEMLQKSGCYDYLAEEDSDPTLE